MTLQTRIFSRVSKLIIKSALIEKGDKVVLGFSGGKDSYSLLMSLLNFKKKSFIDFDLLVVIIDSGFNEDFTKCESFLKKMEVNYLIEKTKISDILKNKFNDVELKTGKCCFLCSRLRRGALYEVMKREKYNKLALGHNFDDAIETYLLNLFYGSSNKIMVPLYKTEDYPFYVIRPLLFIEKKEIVDYVKEKKFEIIKKNCPLSDKNSKRENIRIILDKMVSENKMLYHSFKNAMYKNLK